MNVHDILKHLQHCNLIGKHQWFLRVTVGGPANIPMLCCLHSWLNKMLHFSLKWVKTKIVFLPKFTDSLNSMYRSLRGCGPRLEPLSSGKGRERGWFNDGKERPCCGRKERQECHFWKVNNKIFAIAVDFLHLDSTVPGLTTTHL